MSYPSDARMRLFLDPEERKGLPLFSNEEVYGIIKRWHEEYQKLEKEFDELRRKLEILKRNSIIPSGKEHQPDCGIYANKPCTCNLLVKRDVNM